MVMFAFYSIYFLVAIASAVGIFRWTKKRGVGRALLASVLSVVFLSLFYPIPIHGGFTFLVEIMLSELHTRQNRLEQAVKEDRKEAFRKKLAARFRGPLLFSVQEQQAAEPWHTFLREGGARGWYDTQAGLAWTDMLPLEPTGSPPDLDRAKAFCAGLEPRGFWALPTEAELSLFWKMGGYRLSPLGGYGTVGLIEDIDLQTEMLTIRVNRNGRYAVRCVALGPGAPAAGYSSKDIPLREWNAYQLQKTMPGFPDT
jgi:hypothetical protein